MLKMTAPEKESQREGSTNLRESQQEPRNLDSKKGIIRRLRRGRDARTKFVDSHINKKLAFQIRSLRGDLTQEEAVEKLGMNQNAISRLENPYYGKATLTTLKRIASAYDVGLVVEFVPFSKLINQVSGTHYVEHGLSPETMNVPSFEEELPAIEKAEEAEESIGDSAVWWSKFTNALGSSLTPREDSALTASQQQIREEVKEFTKTLEVQNAGTTANIFPPRANDMGTGQCNTKVVLGTPPVSLYQSDYLRMGSRAHNTRQTHRRRSSGAVIEQTS